MKTSKWMNGLRAFAIAAVVVAGAAATWLPAKAGAAELAERCFGAAGQGCGGWNVVDMPRIAFCVHLAGAGICKVSGGSLSHDPCCATNPKGKMCGGSPETQVCSSSWDKAVRRAVWGYQWTRTVNTNLTNTTGIVDRPKYCALSGSGVHRNDTEHCCSNRSRSANWWENIGRPALRICE